MKVNLKRPLLLFAAGIVSMGILWTGCGKGSEPGPGGNGSTHKVSDFQVTIISHGQVSPGAQYEIHTTVKNISSKDYGGFDHSLKCTVKDTNGALYQEKRYLPELDAGASSPESVFINLPAGKVADAATFTYEIIED